MYPVCNFSYKLYSICSKCGLYLYWLANCNRFTVGSVNLRLLGRDNSHNRTSQNLPSYNIIQWLFLYSPKWMWDWQVNVINKLGTEKVNHVLNHWCNHFMYFTELFPQRLTAWHTYIWLYEEHGSKISQHQYRKGVYAAVSVFFVVVFFC